MEDKRYQILRSVMDPSDIPGATYIDVFEENCRRNPEKVLYYFLEDGYNETSRVTYEEMNTRVKAIAIQLQRSYHKGDRALLLFNTGIEFIACLLGCFYAGIVAVPAYPPRKNRMFNRFEAIVVDSNPACILTTQKIHHDILKNFQDEKCLAGMNYIDYEVIEDKIHDQWSAPDVRPEDLVLLQYTSGSTGKPNGVMVSHANLVHNSECIKQAFGHTEELMGVNWLPGFHDMGLIGALIQPSYTGGSNAIIPPNAFIMKPMNWMRAISKYGSNTAGGPNFAMELCVSRIDQEELAGVNLASVRPFFCGAEPIHADTLKGFEEAFAAYNFHSSQLYPCYGLAESVLIVTGGGLEDEPAYLAVDSKELDNGRVSLVAEEDACAKVLVGCGYPWLGNAVVIADPATHRRTRAGQVGEIWVSGPSVARGYWNKPELSGETFQAHLADTGEGPFLRTGDLGFVHDGQLYITGRIKDLIIIRGINHYPNDIERTVEQSHKSLQPAAGAAFSIEAGREERLVVVHEVRRTAMRELDSEAVFETIRQAITQNHQLQVYAIALIRPGSIPKTSSGKIQRFKSKKEFLEEKLSLVSSWKAEINDNETLNPKPSTLCPKPSALRPKPSALSPKPSALSPKPSALSPLPSALSPKPYADDEVIEWIRNWMGKELKVNPSSIATDKPIASYGLDSLKAVLLAGDASKKFGIDWPLDLFLEDTTIEQIVKKGREVL